MTIVKVIPWFGSAHGSLLHLQEIKAQDISWVAYSLQINLVMPIEGTRIEDDQLSRLHIATLVLLAQILQEHNSCSAYAALGVFCWERRLGRMQTRETQLMNIAVPKVTMAQRGFDVSAPYL